MGWLVIQSLLGIQPRLEEDAQKHLTVRLPSHFPTFLLRYTTPLVLRPFALQLQTLHLRLICIFITNLRSTHFHHSPFRKF